MMDSSAIRDRLARAGFVFALLVSLLGTAQGQIMFEPRPERCDMAKTSLADGVRLITKSDYKEANRVLAAGISALGDCCHSPSVIDDTGQKLTLASGEERVGHLNIAANIRASVLRSRLADRCGGVDVAQ
jgi:hypothetical protein